MGTIHALLQLWLLLGGPFAAQIMQQGVVGTALNTSVPTFSHVSGQSAGAATTTVTLASNPAPGNTVLVAGCTYNNGSASVPTATFVDSNSNSYTVSPNSPVGGTAYSGFCFTGYLLSAPLNASASITFVPSNPTGGYAFTCAEEFHPSGGIPVFDSDTPSGTTGTGSSTTTPTVPVSGASEALLAVITSTGVTYSATGSWTLNSFGTAATAWACEWQVASANTGVGFSWSGSKGYAAIGESIK